MPEHSFWERAGGEQQLSVNRREDSEASPARSELPACHPLTAAEVKDVSPEARNDSAHIFGLETVSGQDGDVFSHKTMPMLTGGRRYTTISVAVLHIRCGFHGCLLVRISTIH